MEWIKLMDFKKKQEIFIDPLDQIMSPEAGEVSVCIWDMDIQLGNFDGDIILLSNSDVLNIVNV